LLAHGYPALEEVARLLRVSSRTFQRQLNREGISYSDLVERCRCKAACEALEHTVHAMTLAAVGGVDCKAFLQGFVGAGRRSRRSEAPSGSPANSRFRISCQFP